VVTLSDGADEEFRVTGAAANDCLVKPFQEEELLTRISAHLALSRLRRELSEREQLLRVETETLNEVARDLAAELDLQALVQNVTDGGTRLTLAQFGAIEAALRESEVRYRRLVQGLPAAVYMCDAEGRVTLFNQAAAELWGREPVLGKDQWCGSWRLYRADGTPLPLDECPMAVALREGRVIQTKEIIIERPDGSRRHVVPHPEPVLDATGAVVGAINMLVDITERKRAERLALEQGARMHAIVNSVIDAIITISPDGTVESVNEAMEKMFGYTAEQVVGRNVKMLMPPPFHDEHDQYLRNYLDSGVAKIIGIGREATAVRKDGSAFPIDLAVTEVKLGDRRLFTGVVKDISERKRAEQALRDSEELFRTVTMNAPVAIFIKDLEGHYTLANPLACQALGRPDGVVGLTDHDLLPAEVADQLRRNDAEVVATGRPLEREEFVRHGGFHGDFLSVKFPLFNTQGEPIGVCGVATEITQRKRAQEALRESEERFARFMHHLPGLAWIKDASGRYVFANEAATKAFQVLAVDLHGKTDVDVFPPETASQFQENDRQALASEAGIQTVETLEHEDGIVHHSLINKFPIPGPEGTSTLVGGMAIDITDRMRAEERLRESEGRFRTLASHAPVGIFQSNRNGDTVFVNESWCEMAGLTAEQARGAGWMSALHPEDCERVIAGWNDAVRKGVPSSCEFRFLRPDGVVTWLQGDAVPLRNAAGQLVGFIGTVVDVTTRKDAEGALKEADRRKDEFLAVLAHELRNPLAPIRTGLELMRLAGDDRALIEDVRATMERQTQQMVRLIDDLLDVSRITRGTVELRRCRVELSSVLESAVETVRSVIDELEHTLEVSLPKEPVVLDADPTRLGQVISNLLNNAAKYMHRGGKIWLTAKRQGQLVTVSVKDSGIGIPAEMLERIFDMFAQVDRSMERSHGGLGIGLTLVKRLVEMHGGTVQAYSAGPGQGSEFVVRLPVMVGLLRDLPSTEGDDVKAAGKRRVLVVDDNQQAAEVLGMLLNALGNDVRIAYDGLAAIDVAAEFRPDVVLLDIGMPKLNGYDTARRLREHPWGQNMVLAALTGWGQEEDQRRTKEAGFDYHFVKPVEPAALRKLLAD
jgi:PAS domain S-box-containing protein